MTVCCRSRRAIRKIVPAALFAAAQLFLLMRWRSLRQLVNSKIHASMNFEPNKLTRELVNNILTASKNKWMW